MDRLPISVVIIAKNEESRLRDCLESVRWADEILLIDDNSTDKTAEIALQFSARVVRRAMVTEGRHRNAAYDLAKHDWILSLDADERVSVELKNEITELFRSGADANGYSIPRRNFVGDFWAKHGGMYPSAQLRLFQKGSFRFDEEAEVHPPVSYYKPGKWGHLKSDILHYTYRDFSDAIAKLDRQTDLEARKWIRENRPISAWGATRKMCDRFWRAYISKKGFKDGKVGLFLAVNSGMYQFLSYAKTWELRREARTKKSDG